MEDTAGDPVPPEQRPVGAEARKTLAAKYREGFIARYLSGNNILDVGYRGYVDDHVVPIVPQAIGIDPNYPGYDGLTLPFPDDSQDAVFSSHCLEHIDDYVATLREWHRVLRVGGYMIVAVPHQFLYEKQTAPPSRFNEDHKRFYTPGSLLAEVEEALAPNSYRLRHLADNDRDFTYCAPPDRHSGGSYEIEMVLQKIARPPWMIAHEVICDIGPDSALIEWQGFSVCEVGYRWTDGQRAVMRFHLTDAEQRSINMPGTRIGIIFDAFGRQRVRALLNGEYVYEGEHHGAESLLEFPTRCLRTGANELLLELPNATQPAAPSDPRHVGVAVRSIKFLRASSTTGGKVPGIGAAVRRRWTRS